MGLKLARETLLQLHKSGHIDTLTSQHGILSRQIPVHLLRVIFPTDSIAGGHYNYPVAVASASAVASESALAIAACRYWLACTMAVVVACLQEGTVRVGHEFGHFLMRAMNQVQN